MRPGSRLALLALYALLCTSGCKVTAEDIEYWKGTVKGPGKIVAVILSDNYDLELRTQAALALVEMDREDVEGVAELQRALQRLDAPTRQQIIDGMVPGLEAILRGGDSAAPADPNSGPPPRQVRAKDAGFLLITHASPQSRERLTRAVIGWYTQDFFGRSLSGSYSAEQVVRQLGSPAAGQLIDAMNQNMPPQALTKVAELVGQLGDAATKQRAAERLVQLEQQMEGQEFLDYLKGRIREQLRTQNPGVQIDENRVTVAATTNRETFINDGALPAMKQLASQPVVSSRLIAIASNPAATPEMVERRRRALAALEGNARPEHLQPLLALALDSNAPTPVRDYAFDRVGDLRDPTAIPPMWALVQQNGDQRLRWRAGEMVLAIGGPAVVGEFFSKLPAPGEDGYAPEELEGYATRLGQMTPLDQVTPIVRNQLNAAEWYKKIIALRFFERKGVAADVAAMQRLRNDGTAVAGPPRSWPQGTTVGRVATESIQALQQRLAGGGAAAQPAPAQPAPPG